MTEQIHLAVLAQARRTPEAIAVIAGNRRITYAELDRMAIGVAQALRRDGVRAGDLVALCVERDEWLLAGLLGILRVGAAYLPLDSRLPVARLRGMVHDAAPVRQLATSRTASLLPDLAYTLVDEVVPANVRLLAEDPNNDGVVGDDGVAYVLYTSGSTGRPKGVVVEHRQAMVFIMWAASRLSAAEVAGSLAAITISFDAAALELIVPLVCGGAVILAEDLLAVRTLPAREEITMLLAAPAALAALLTEGVDLPALRTVHVGGEQLPASLRDRAFALPGVTRMINWYGPTECAIACIAHEMAVDAEGQPPQEGEPPLGVAFGGAQLSVRGEDAEPVAQGATGELWVSGPCVTRGYLNQSELTEQRFVRMPDARWYRTGDLVRYADGVYHYVGRTDDQVKINGVRVELGEINAILSTHAAVGHTYTITSLDADGSTQLVAYAEHAPTATVTEDELRHYLRDRLPTAMVPSRVVLLDQLPRTPSGKVDRAALPAPGAARPAHTPPRTEVERYVAEVWADVLNKHDIGAFDDFYLLGGASLTAARVSTRIAEQLGLRADVRTLLSHPVLADFARAVEDGLLASTNIVDAAESVTR